MSAQIRWLYESRVTMRLEVQYEDCRYSMVLDTELYRDPAHKAWYEDQAIRELGRCYMQDKFNHLTSRRGT